MIKVNPAVRAAMLSDGSIVPVTVFISSDGDDCGPEDAICAVAGRDGVGWWCLYLPDWSYEKPN